MDNVDVLKSYNITWGEDPNAIPVVYKDSEYRMTQAVKELKNSIKETACILGKELIELNRSCARLLKHHLGKSLKNTRLREEQKERLYDFFALTVVGSGDNIRFLKIFEAKSRSDTSNLYQLLGSLGTKSDITFDVNHSTAEKTVNVLECLTRLYDGGKRQYIDASLFLEQFGKMPYCYFVDGLDCLIRHIKLKTGKMYSYSEFFRDVYEDITRITDIVISVE